MKNIVSFALMIVAIGLLASPLKASPDSPPGLSDGLCSWFNTQSGWQCQPNYQINCAQNGGYCKVRRQDNYCYCEGLP